MKWLPTLLLLTACHGRSASTAEKSAPYDTSCQHDTECVPEPDCCPTPCTESVINASELQRARSALDCSASGQCPQAGGCRTFAYLCVSHQCKLVFDGDPGYHERQVP